jgi:hypothetical protein
MIKKVKKIIWVYERDGKNIYRRPFGKLYPKELIVLNTPINNN